jgi:hypothetical protein
MVEGGITATTSNGSIITGVSKSVSQKNDLLSFVLVSGLEIPEPVKNVYCEVVSTEKLGSFVTGLDFVAFELAQQVSR